MAIVRDIMPRLRALSSSTTIDDTLATGRTAAVRKDAWVMAGGLDTFDWWLKRPHQAPQGGDRSEPGGTNCAGCAK